ncbi:MAG: transporter substrate-binding domain-containing protein [Actinophytocola sp.]|nr:transporter substrate-binding domain-containing protein [Actinophytocola sp.]
MRIGRVLRTSAVVAAASLALAACGDDGGNGGEAGGEEGGVAEKSCEGGGDASVTIGTKFDQPGLGQKTPEGMDGFDIAVACYIAKQIHGDDVNVEWKEAPSAERENLLERGDVDMVVATYTINDERKQKIDFAGPYLLAHQDLLVRADYEEIKSEEDLKDASLKLCSVTGSTSAQNVKDDFAPNADLVEYGGYSECMTGLQNEAVDAVTTDNSILAGFASAEQYKDKFKLMNFNLSDEPYGVGIKKGETELRDQINAAIEKMVADGDWQKFFDTHLGPSGFKADTPTITEK